jgi:hypothetical protein
MGEKRRNYLRAASSRFSHLNSYLSFQSYSVGLVFAGAMIGYVLFLLLEFATVPFSDSALRVSLSVWAVIGGIRGICAYRSHADDFRYEVRTFEHPN